MTDATVALIIRQDLQRAIVRLRKVADETGSLHPLWDFIFECEEHLRIKPVVSAVFASEHWHSVPAEELANPAKNEWWRSHFPDGTPIANGQTNDGS